MQKVDGVLIQNPERGVHAWNVERARLAANSVDWQDLRALLAVVDSGGLRAAASHTGASVNTVRRRIDRLETATGVQVLARSSTGAVPTEAGRLFVRVAREMSFASLGAAVDDQTNVLVSPGELRIGCTEGLGSLWLTPRLADLCANVDGLTVSLQLDYDVVRDRSAEVDIGIAFAPPARPDLVCAKLATLHYHLFASTGYLERFGQMRSLDEYRSHRFVEQAGAGIAASLINVLVGTDRPKGFLPIRSNSALSVYWAVSSGAGIAALPTYARVVAPSLIPMEASLPLRFELWYYFHPEARQSPAIRSAVEWLKMAFEPVANPWFSDRFVHPIDFPPPREDNVVSLFGGLFDNMRAEM